MSNDPILDRFLNFLDAGPTPHHVVRTAADWLEGHGFSQVSIKAEPTQLPSGFKGYVVEEGSFFAFRVGRKPIAEAGFRIVAAHTDSPNLRIKPRPLQRSHGYVRLGVEVYGGVQVATWVDRDLGLAGVVYVRDGDSTVPRLLDIRRPIARIPTLAIHLNRKVNTDGLKLNNQTELPALFALDSEAGSDPLRALIGQELEVEPDRVLTWDLSLFNLTPATLGGAHNEFIFSARLDNLGSCHAALEGLIGSLQGDVPGTTSVVALFDHEEIGSRTHRGADGRALEQVLSTIHRDATDAGAGTLSRALANSWLLSADMAHAVHPSFADKSDAEHAPRINEGPAIKLNSNQRYTSEGATTAAFALLCERAEVPYQWFTTRADMSCGSTVGPLLASRMGLRAVDVGNPMLSMHSVREQCGALDHGRMASVMQRFFGDPLG